MPRLEAWEVERGGEQAFQTPTNGVAPNGLPYFTWDQGALQLNREGWSWAATPGTPVAVTYAFRVSGAAPADTGVSGFQQFNSIQIAVAEQMLARWAEVANITFVRAGDGHTNNATILFGNFVTGPAQFSAFAYLPEPGATDPSLSNGDVWVNISRNYDANPAALPLGAQILLHEIGHTLGLLHPSVYDGGAQSGVTYNADADFWQDTRQFTVQSYFNETFTGASYGEYYVTSPQMFDIAAAQYLYGPNMTTRTGDTVYGFHSNTGIAAFSIGASTQGAIFCIWDAGGIDTIDVSGYNTASEIDLRPESFSSAGNHATGAMIGNISIARGVIIENAIGGGGDDTIIGNDVANALRGGDGSDTLSGGAGNDILDGGAGPDSMAGGQGADTYIVDNIGDTIAETVNAGTDMAHSSLSYTLPDNVENLILTGVGAINGSGNALANLLAGNGSANVLNGEEGNDVISGLGGADTISGGSGNDVLYGYSAGATGEITSTLFSAGFSQPVAATSTSADPGFLYVAEKSSGIIWRIDEATGQRTTFLDIPQEQFSRDGERGLLGIAFHPDYETNGRFFVFVTDPQGDLQIREYHRASGSVPPASETTFSVVIDIPKGTVASNHNGGWIGFSPIDGMLYITTGDGGGSGDPNNNAQNLDVLLGKMLRIDVNGDDFPADGNRNYAIPDDNPFVGVAGADEIWAYGLRNPWRAAFDPATGDIYIGDVGQQAREEVDFIAAGVGGLNFGWRIMEGHLPYSAGPPGTPQAGDPSLTLPVFDYERSVGTTITGGELYAGAQAGFVGQYVFADYGSGAFFTLAVVDGAAIDVTQRTNQLVGQLPSALVDFVSGTNGMLYAIGIGGNIWRITPGLGAEDVGDNIFGDAGNDTIFGNAGDDALDGGDDNDKLDGGLGDDRLFGGNGDDALSGDAGADVLDGGAGSDTVRYLESPLAVIVNLSTLVGAGGHATGDTYIGVENIVGSNFADTLTGSAGLNNLNGWGGNDVLIGGAGTDTLNGSSGIDTASYENAVAGLFALLAASSGNTGEAAGDTYISIENLRGSNFADQLTGNAGVNRLEGGGGDDALTGGAGADVLDGGSGTDAVRYFDSAAGVRVNLTALTGNGGDATGDIYMSIENVTGSTFNDTLTGSAGANTLHGWSGDDLLIGGAGGDILNGGAGTDIASYENATTGVVASLATPGTNTGDAAGDSYVSIETLRGSSFDDQLTGNAGANRLEGRGGDDILTGGAGADTFDGGSGSDTVAYVGSSAAVTVNLTTRVGSGGDAVGDSYASIENATGSNHADTLIGSSGANVLNGGDGADTLTGSAGSDTFVFVAGQANGDTIIDFDGLDASVGDTLQFVGYGTAAQGATFVQINDTQWQITSADGAVVDVINFVNPATIDPNDYLFGGP